MTAIPYSFGREISDARPAQAVASSFDDFAAVLQVNAAPTKAISPYFCGPMGGDGRRCAENAEASPLLVLDADTIATFMHSVWRAMLAAGYRGLVHATHSSTADARRDRAILIATRPMSRDERIAVGGVVVARFAKTLGDYVKLDPSTHRPEQPVFFPPRGAELQSLAGPQLDVDEHLRAAAEMQLAATPRESTAPSVAFATETPAKQAEILAMVRSALTRVPAHERDLWIRMAHCLRPLGDAGFELWAEWSRTSPEFTEEGLDKWPKRATRAGWKGVITAAKKFGFVPPPRPVSAAGFGGVPMPPGASDVPPPTVAGAEASAGGTLPEIEIVKGQRAAVVTALAAGFAAGGPYYRRESVLVRATTLPADELVAGIQRFKGSVLLREPRGPAVISDASRYVICKTFDGRTKGFKVIDLPEQVAQSFIETGLEQRALPSIVGVTRCPVMNEDGSLRLVRGYDPVTKLILAGEEDWSKLAVPERATKDHAAAELAFLLGGPLHDFPFADDSSRSVAVSIIATAVLRPAMDCAPMHGVSAPGHGEGKTLLAKLAAIVASGTLPAMIAPGHSQEEFEKRIDAAILSGDPICVLDNVSRPITGDGICAAMTSPMAKIRKFGSNDDKTVATSAFWIVAGKNLAGTDDMLRRMVSCYIDAHTEQPEFRTGFKIPRLIEWALANRMRLLSAVYTILRAHAQADYPSEGQRLLGNFETWSRRVAHALVWLGMVNPVRSQERLRRDDTKRENRGALFAALHAWQSLRPQLTQPWTVREVKEAVQSASFARDGGVTQSLAEAVAASVPGGIEQLPYFLRQHKNATTDGYRLEQGGAADGHNNVIRWLISAPRGDARDARDARDG